MKLLRLELRNFKGQRHLVVEPNGADLAIFGDNATGKTTITDAYSWLLFDKDSSNRKDFDIKTLDSAGEPIHFLEHEVNATFDVGGGRTLKLTKIYYEKWEKPRGQLSDVFAGHTTDYKVNDVPVDKRSYDGHVAVICDSRRLSILSFADYFNSDAMKTKDSPSWQERRKVLLEVCGDVSDADVIASSKDLASLPSILNGRSMSDHRAIVKASRSKIADEAKGIPIRIEELTRSMPAVATAVDPAPLREQIQDLTERRASLSAGGMIAEKKSRLRTLEGDAQAIINSLKMEVSKGLQAASNAAAKATAAVSAAEAELSTVTRQSDALAREISSLEERRTVLLQRKASIDAEVFTFTGEDTCAACGQSLPPERVAEARLKAEELFNKSRAERLQRNLEDGKALRKDLDALKADEQEHRERIAAIGESLEGLRAERDRLHAEAESLQMPQVDLGASQAYQDNLRDQEAVKAEIASLEQGSTSGLAEIDSELAALRTKLQEAEQSVARSAQRKETETRIQELARRERELAAQIEKIDGEIFLIEEFIRAKVALLTERINSRFKVARFKLFETQVNGAVNEVCETTFGGVPYSSLNHGSRLNVGLDIINTLAEHFGFAPPIFIDNAESVTSIVPTTGQQIRLIVSEPDKSLRIETINRAETREAILA